MNELTDIDTQMRLLGGFWSQVYGAPEEVRTLCAVATQFAAQGAVDALTASRACGRRAIEPYRRTRLFPLTLRASQRNATPGALLRYGEGAVYGPQSSGITYNYGESLLPTAVYPVPTGLRSFSTIVPRITNPGAIWTPGVDVAFDPERRVLIFKEDPLENPYVSVVQLADDVTARLWLVDAMLDEGDVYTRHGFAFRFGRSTDSAELKRILGPVVDGVISGNNRQTFCELLSEATGVPVAHETEAVEIVAEDHRGWFLGTPNHIYRLPSEPPFVAGQTITEGTFLTEDVQLHDFGRGTVPAWVPDISLGLGTTQAELVGLTLRNTAVPLTVTTSSVRFDIGTSPAAADFFALADARALAAGTTLRAYFELAFGTPLPETINPLAFFAEQWLRGSWYLVKLSAKAAARATFHHLTRLVDLCPPNVLLVLAADCPAQHAPLRIGESRLGTWTGTDPVSASFGAPACRVAAQYIDNCQS